MSKKKRHDHTAPQKTPVANGPVYALGTSLKINGGILFLFGIVAYLLYRNILQAPFIWDDRYLIIENHFIRNLGYALEGFKHHLYYSSAGLSNFYRPLQTLLLAVDYLFWKNNPFGYHITSIIFHLLCAFASYAFIYVLFKKRAISLMVGLLFLVHPINSTVVDYISSRADSQAAFFMLTSLAFFFRSYKKPVISTFFFGALASFLLALLSKEMAIILPFLLVISVPIFCEYNARGEERRLFKRAAPFFVLLAAYIALRLTVLNFPAASTQKPPSLYIRLLTTSESFVRLIGLLFLPLKIHIEKNIPFSTGIMQVSSLISTALLAALGVCICFIRRHSKMFSFGLIWFFVALIPMANIRPINATIADHWLYLPCIGFFLAVIGGVTDLKRSVSPQLRNHFQRAAIILYAAAILLFSIRTIRQNTIWAEPVAFYRQALKFSPKSFRAHNEIGIIYLDQKKIGDALEEFKKAIALNAQFDQAYDNLGIAFDLKGDYENAILAHQKALSINPYNPKIYNNLGNAYNKSGRFDEAIAAYKQALMLNPSYKAVYNNIAVIYYKKGKFKEAREYWQKTLRIDPNFEMAIRNLEVLKRRLANQ